MKSRSNSCCCFTPGGANKNINVFDRGWIANVAWFFNYSYFWFLPFANIYDTDGKLIKYFKEHHIQWLHYVHLKMLEILIQH